MVKKPIKTATIDVANRIASIVSSRDVINNLKNEISKLRPKIVLLDFSNVQFVSRSAAHELLSLKEDLKRKVFKKKKVEFINTNEDVKKMLRIVAMNKAVPEKSKPEFEAETVSIDSLLKTCKCK